jgi:rhamnogalacturonyl hydrolase YesR
MAYWFYFWDWGEGIAFEGLDAWAAATGQPQFRDFVTATLDRWMQITKGKPSRFGPAVCLLSRRHSPEYLAFARRIGDVLLEAPVERGTALLDHPSRSIFVDSLCSDPPFLLQLTEATGDERYARRAGEILLGHCRMLQNETTGLFSHFTDLGSGVAPGIPWGRGNGWATLGLASYVSDSHTGTPERAEAIDRLRALCEGLGRHRIPNAGWRNLIDRPESYPESSTTVLVACALVKALRAGVLGPEWQEMADETWQTVEHRIDTSGHLVSVSYRPGVNTDPSRYEHAPALGGAYPWAQGPYLLAAAQRWAVDQAAGEARGRRG